MKGGIVYPQGYSQSINVPNGSPSAAAIAINSKTQVVSGADSKGGARGGASPSTISVSNVQSSSYPTNYPATGTSQTLMQVQTKQLVNAQGDSTAASSGGRTKRRHRRRRKQKQRTTKRRYRKRSRKYRM